MIDVPFHIVCFGEVAAEALATVRLPSDVEVVVGEEGQPTPGASLYVVSGEFSAELSVEPDEGLARSFSAPVIYLVSPALVEQVLPLLRSCDDLCVWPTAPELLGHRLQHMIQYVVPHVAGGGDGQGPDPLTGLDNRPLFVANLERLLEAAQPDQRVSMLLLDLDLFKSLNDTYGHVAGDAILQQVGQLIQSNLPEAACVGRIGGEEFGVALIAFQAEAVAVAEQLRCKLEATALRLPAGTQTASVYITVSVGVATYPAVQASYDLLSSRADKALYAAKANGRNQVCHVATIEQLALDKNSNLHLESFENMVRVLSERVGETLVRRGRRMLDEMRLQAERDALTGLYSRHYFNNRLEFEFEDATEKRAPITVALLDVDFFGQVNKVHGWPSGDKVLADVAAVLKSSIRRDDWVARYGGEEFCIVMQGTSLAQAELVLERIRANTEATQFYSTSEQPLAVTISIGATMLCPSDEAPDAILERASQHLLQAKNQGRNQVVLG